MADAVRVARLLRGVTEGVVFLERKVRADSARRADVMWLLGAHRVVSTDLAARICDAD